MPRHNITEISLLVNKTIMNYPTIVHPFSLIRSNYVIAGSTLYRGHKIENDDVSFEDNFISIKYTIQFSLAMHYKRYLTSKWWQIDTYVTVIDLKITCIYK